MHNSFYFLSRLAKELDDQLRGSILTEVISQNKDEAVFTFDSGGKICYLQAYLKPYFACLNLPTHFIKSSKNVAVLFSEIYNLKVLSIRVCQNERAIMLNFENNNTLIFKMFGNKSNIIWYQNSTLQKIFKNSIKNDLLLQLAQFDVEIDQSFENFSKIGLNAFPTLKKADWQQYWAENTIEKPLDQYNSIINTIKNYDQNPIYIHQNEGKYSLSLSNDQGIYKQFDYAILAISEFFKLYISDYHFNHEKYKIIAQIERSQKKTNESLQYQNARLNQLDNGNQYSQWADIIMANLHQKHNHDQSEIELFNFYTNQNQLIKIKPKLSLQKTAEWYYQKSKNQHIELEIIKRNIASLKDILIKVNRDFDEINSITTYKELTTFSKKYVKVLLATEADELPFKEEFYQNWQILIGKNAQNNDLLTLKYAKKNDLWLHAKDVVGSHVVIKQKSGLNYPKPVIEYAAQLAAFYSKRKNDSLCPVIVTEKKYVRKTKNLPAGKVIVDKEEIILVQPLRK